ncbi:MAG: acetyl esterase/lipase [Candidatus Endobugula sp.]|jgi:acetyl esterase/lipase
MADAAQALAWTAQCTNQPIVLMRHSAGAHIEAILALDDQCRQRVGVAHTGIAGLVGLSGPYDFSPLKDERVNIIFSAANAIAHTQPTNYVTPLAPPTLVLHGTREITVKPFNSERLAKKLSDPRVSTTLKWYPNSGHAAIVGALSIPLREQLPVLTDINAFLQGPVSKHSASNRYQPSGINRSLYIKTGI